MRSGCRTLPFKLALGLKKTQQDPADAKARFDLGIQYQELKLHSEAVDCFRKTFEMNGQPAALLYGAISEKLQGRFNEALELIDRAIAAGLDTFNVRLERGNVLLALARPSEALQDYKSAQRFNPENPIAVFNCGLALRRLNNRAAAEEHYETALRLDPTFAKAALELATLLDEESRQKEAVALLESLIAGRPDYREARLTLAKDYIRLERSADAVNLLRNTPENDAIAQSLLGAAFLQGLDLDNAERHLKLAVQNSRTSIDARINLSRLYMLRGETSKAERFRLAAAAALAQASQKEGRPSQ